MKKFCMAIILLFSTANLLYSQNAYYQYKGKKIPLTSDSSIFYLRFKQKSNKETIATKLKVNHSDVLQISDSEFTVKAKGKINPEANFGQSNDFEYSAPLLKNDKATMVVMSNIVVQLKEGHTIEEILTTYKKDLILKKDRGYNTYILKCKRKTSQEILDIANAISEKQEMVEWCEPEFYSNYTAADDPLYPGQYYLRNTGSFGGVPGIDINVEPAWSITRGSNSIRVAVIDEGVDEHEDFAGRLLSGFTAGTTTGNGSPQNGVKGHGVACAGIIAATHNDIGIKGVAPNVQIVPVNIFPNTPDPGLNPAGAATSDQIAQAIDWAWNQGAADVLSNSWGGGAQSNNIDAAILRARTQGRNNGGFARGCPVVFASGNSATGGNVSYPAYVDGVITVGACNNAAPSGNIWYYSNRGPSMDLVAPSGDVNLMGDVITTDRMGIAGYETDNYTHLFGGTSAACPQVSGVAALMLSINPNLTGDQVRSILQSTATDMGTSGFDNTFGYGRLNACAAVFQALEGCSISGPDNFCANAVFGIPGLDAGTTVTWSTTPSGVISLSGSGSSVTATRLYPQNVTLNASVVTSCGSFTLSKPITNLLSAPEVMYFNGGTYYDGSTVSLQRGSTNASIPLVPGATSYYWSVSSNASITYGQGSNYVSLDVASAGSFSLSVQPVSQCGDRGYPITINGTVNGGPIDNEPVDLMSFSISPNPAASTINVESAEALTDDYSVEVYDLYNAKPVLTQKAYKGSKKSQMQVGHLRRGQYILVIKNKKGEIVKKRQVILN